MKLTLLSNLKTAELIWRKASNYFAKVCTFQIHVKKPKRAAVNCTTEAGAINCKLFLTPKLWILCKSQFRDIYHPCLSFIGKIPRITCVHAGLLSLPSVRWAGASGTRSQWLSSFHIFLQLLLLVCAATVPSFCFSAPPFIAETGVTLFWEVTGRECCQAKSGFSPPQNPNWATSEWSHQMFSYISPKLRGRQNQGNED